MFTGIVQNQGRVIKKEKRGGVVHLGLRFKRKETGLRAGESIAVDGVCLTVAKIARNGFEADIVRETLDDTTLGSLRLGDWLNLERSLKKDDRVGGHFVTGHVDGRGRIEKIKRSGRNLVLQIAAPKAIIRSLAAKGSVAVDGISLTVQALKGMGFKVAVVPHTLRETTLSRKRVGDFVNLEEDLIFRYLKRIDKSFKSVHSSLKRRPTLSVLKHEGF